MKSFDIQVLHTFFAHLARREKLILCLAVFFVSLTLLDRLMISPIFSKIKSLNEEIKIKESAIKKDLRILALKDRILEESAKYASLLNNPEFNSEEERATFLLKEIEGLANKNSVYLVDMKPMGLKDIGSVKKYLITLNSEAQMEQLINFIFNIESSNKLLRVERYQISPKSKESTIAKCDMLISQITMP